MAEAEVETEVADAEATRATNESRNDKFNKAKIYSILHSKEDEMTYCCTQVWIRSQLLAAAALPLLIAKQAL